MSKHIEKMSPRTMSTNIETMSKQHIQCLAARTRYQMDQRIWVPVSKLKANQTENHRGKKANGSANPGARSQVGAGGRKQETRSLGLLLLLPPWCFLCLCLCLLPPASSASSLLLSFALALLAACCCFLLAAVGCCLLLLAAALCCLLLLPVGCCWLLLPAACCCQLLRAAACKRFARAGNNRSHLGGS